MTHLAHRCITKSIDPADLVAPALEQSTATGPTGPTMGEPSIATLVSPGGGLHDEGDPGAEEMWGAVATSSGLARASTKLAGNASGSAV